MPANIFMVYYEKKGLNQNSELIMKPITTIIVLFLRWQYITYLNENN